jgi:hypothetical protein
VPFAPSCGNLLKCWRKLRSVLAVVVLSLCAAQLTAQPAPNIDGEFAVLIDGLGNYSRPISTKSELAQKFFDQGLRLVYGYYSPEATASLKKLFVTIRITRCFRE